MDLTSKNRMGVSGHGIMSMQCAHGFYLSRFSSAFDGSERFYKFGCSRFSSNNFNEKCTMSEPASTENGDMYLSCVNDQYIVGIEIIEDVTTGMDSWQLLCCQSDAIKLRLGDCIDTKFVNDYRRSSTFSSSAQIIRKLQAMPENGDLRWWLQLCPVDVAVKKPRTASTTEIRAKRQMPWNWSRGRFPTEYNPLYLTHMQREEAYYKAIVDRENANNRVDDTSRTSEASEEPSITTTTLNTPKVTPTRLVYRSNNNVKSTGIRTRIVTPPSITTPRSSSPPTTTREKPVEALDYYDMYDDNFDKKKHTEGGFLRGVSDFLQNIQDGLTLAQAAFPADSNNNRNANNQNNNFHLRIAVTPPPPFSKRAMPNVMFSDDEDNLQIGPFVQQWDSRLGAPPRAVQSTTVPTQPKREVNTIEGMLQMFGLCQGHPEL